MWENSTQSESRYPLVLVMYTRWHLYCSMEVPRYHPFTPCADQVPLTVGFSCIIICVPGGGIGVVMWFNSPWSWAYPDNFGFMHNFWSKLSLRLTCGRSQHHRCSGNSVWVLANPEIKCSLKFRMARSTEFM